jgi:hypothetical protein
VAQLEHRVEQRRFGRAPMQLSKPLTILCDHSLSLPACCAAASHFTARGTGWNETGWQDIPLPPLFAPAASMMADFRARPAHPPATGRA